MTTSTQIPRLFLASQSPRRFDILTQHGFCVETIPNQLQVEDDFNPDLPIAPQAEALALKKARLSRAHYQGIVIAADTIVVKDSQCLGKPASLSDAEAMLSLLSGYTHQVISAVALIYTLTGEERILSDTTYVTFNALSADQIHRYVHTCSPLDKSGSYGIQELPPEFIHSIEGSLFNVVGFPIEKAGPLIHALIAPPNHPN